MRAAPQRSKHVPRSEGTLSLTSVNLQRGSAQRTCRLACLQLEAFHRALSVAVCASACGERKFRAFCEKGFAVTSRQPGCGRRASRAVYKTAQQLHECPLNRLGDHEHLQLWRCVIKLFLDSYIHQLSNHRMQDPLER